MKANILGITVIYGLWMLIHNTQAEGSENDVCKFPSDLDGICAAINQIHDKIYKLESTRLKSEKELLTQFISTVREQLDKESELKAKIVKWESDYKLLQDAKMNIEKTLSEVQANLGHQIESLENDNKKLKDEKINIEKTLAEVKNNSEDQIGSLKNTNSLIEVETNKLKANLSEFTDLADKPTPQTSCNNFKHPSGIQTITLPQNNTFQVLCESEVAGPGWTVIQKRFNGCVDFYQNWCEYKKGFGSLNEEFFLGLQIIHLLTNYEPHEFHAHFEYFDGRIGVERCNNFKVASEEEGFMLTVGECTGSEEYNSISRHNECKFSTKDRDNDKWNEGDCAEYYHSGWWHNGCGAINPNGKYYPQGDGYLDNMFWSTHDNLKTIQMLIRPKSS